MKRRRILVAPLDWGMGHATRCVPLIDGLLEDGQEIIITAHGSAESFLKKEYPDLEFISSPSYKIRYSTGLPLWFMIMIQCPGILLNIFREHHWLSNFIKRRQIDQVISDNRYGLWSDKIKSVFITHQMMIKCPAATKFIEPFLHRMVIYFTKKYTECWIPDIKEAGNLSGDLSHRYKLPDNAKFIGWLSRFNDEENFAQTKPELNKYSVCFILSGPEPQRTTLENKILALKTDPDQKMILIQGKPGENKREQLHENLLVISHTDSDELRSILQNSELIVCRAGYSSIMDLKVLGKKAILIPTPGQTEQEYLAEYLQEKGEFICIKQADFEKHMPQYLQKLIPNNKIIAEAISAY